jgi:hypothetical protein
MATAKALALVLALGAFVLLAGCGAGTACVAGAPGGGTSGECVPETSRGAVRMARSGGLTVTLAITPSVAKAGSTVAIELTARARHAAGALGYLLRYGDGRTSGLGAVPQFCIAGAAPPAHRSWRATHRYRAPGSYIVSASVYINCTQDRATATARLAIR